MPKVQGPVAILALDNQTFPLTSKVRKRTLDFGHWTLYEWLGGPGILGGLAVKLF